MSRNFLTYELTFSLSVLRSLVLEVVGRVHQWSLCLRMLGKGIQLKTTTLLFFIYVVSRDFKKHVNNSIVDHLEKCDLFSDFRSSRSTADLFTVLSGRIVRVLNRSAGTRVVALDICKAFDRV